jgi:hypothetical protein
MRLLLSTVLFLAVVSGIGCDKNPAGNDFSNELTLGTGQSGFDLTGVSTSFTRNSIVFWRLESADDMAGSQVIIKIDTITGANVGSSTFNNPQSYGHIMVSQVTVPGNPGSYRATGILATGNKTVAGIDFTVE